MKLPALLAIGALALGVPAAATPARSLAFGSRPHVSPATAVGPAVWSRIVRNGEAIGSGGLDLR